MKNLQRHQRSLVLAATVSLIALLLMPAGRFLPLVYLDTHIHELCHALASLATGGRVLEIGVLRNGEGFTKSVNGIPHLVTSAGYIGATLVGGLMILFSRNERTARQTLLALGTSLAIALLLWVRTDLVGVISALAWIGVSFSLCRFATGLVLVFFAQLIGIQQCVHSLESMIDLLWISMTPGPMSDAQIMANQTILPPLFWASTWSIISIIVLTLSIGAAWRSPTSRR